MKKILSTLIILLAAVLPLKAEDLLINGAGATFPYPIYAKWFSEYNKIHPDRKFNYQSIGSGGGIRQVSAGTVDFGATDGPMTDSQLEAAPGLLLHIPTVLGAVVVTYNIPGVSQQLKFSQKTLANIFLGNIKNWNHPEIQAANPGVQLPSEPILVVHRSDGSGTTFIFVDFLSKVSNEWSTKVGRGTSVSWPVGLGGKGNEGVTGLVKQTPYSIGYVELIYAKQSKLLYGLIQNKSGKFMDATLESVSSAAKTKIPSDYRVSITNSPSADSYPLSSFTWLLVYQKQKDVKKGSAIVDFLKWMKSDGQKFASDLGYAPLPKEVQEKLDVTIAKIKY